uniref:DNA helicase MCM9 n=1 Tax=Strigamia maritima TaxID=126957 RepID=T1IPA6_STRMM
MFRIFSGYTEISEMIEIKRKFVIGAEKLIKTHSCHSLRMKNKSCANEDSALFAKFTFNSQNEYSTIATDRHLTGARPHAAKFWLLNCLVLLNQSQRRQVLKSNEPIALFYFIWILNTGTRWQQLMENETNMEKDERQNQTQHFLNILIDYASNQHRNDLIEILLAEEKLFHFSVVINTMTLFEMTVDAGEQLFSDPANTLLMFDKALVETANCIYSQHERNEEMIMKTRIHARFNGMPLCPEITRNNIPKNADFKKFLCICGIVVRASGVRILEFEKEYLCNKCKSKFTLKACIEESYKSPAPTTCPDRKCTSTKFTLLPTDSSRCRDYQEIKIQEQLEQSSIQTPRSITVVLEDDLTDACKPGDDVEVSGLVLRRWHSATPNLRPVIELFVKANYVEVINNNRGSHRLLKDEKHEEFKSFWDRYKSNPIAGRNKILENFCPQVYGLYLVKLSLAVVLAGGVAFVNPSGTCIRGEPHLLLVGDPGTGKSQFLKYAAKVCRRSVLTTGIGCTSAGLTVTATKQGGEWQLEAGALVLADGGVCCIDEFSRIKEHDKTSIHEAMEQQCINVAKAGQVCKLNTRCTIIAATNSKGSYDADQPLNVNIALGSPLLSRFDLILVLLDTRIAECDRMLSTLIISRKETNSHNEYSSSDTSWNLEKMQAYFCLIRALKPTLSEFSHRILKVYYQTQRQADLRNAARTTVRLLESLIRLAQGHARLMFRNEVTVEDAVVTISLMETSMQGTALIEGLNALHSKFPEDAQSEYRTQAQLVLSRLGLHDILEHEISRLDELENESESQIRRNENDDSNENNSVETQVIDAHTKLKNKLQKFAFTKEVNNEPETTKKRKNVFNREDDSNDRDFHVDRNVNKKSKL